MAHHEYDINPWAEKTRRKTQQNMWDERRIIHHWMKKAIFSGIESSEMSCMQARSGWDFMIDTNIFYDDFRFACSFLKEFLHVFCTFYNCIVGALLLFQIYFFGSNRCPILRKKCRVLTDGQVTNFPWNKHLSGPSSPQPPRILQPPLSRHELTFPALSMTYTLRLKHGARSFWNICRRTASWCWTFRNRFRWFQELQKFRLEG